MSSPSSAEGRGQGAAPIRVALLGSTGSIGRQAVDVLAAHPEAFTVVALLRMVFTRTAALFIGFSLSCSNVSSLNG